MPELETIDCDHDGIALRGRIARPQGSGPHPAVLVMHSALGLRHMVSETAQRLAGLGYVAVASDMYGRDADYGDEMKAGACYMDQLQNPDRQRARIVRWFETVAALPDVDANRIAAIGYCYGGTCVLELARSGADVKAVISYHGILTTHAPATPGSIRGEVAAYCGLQDPYAPPETIEGLRRELAAAGARYQIMEFAQVAHGFTDPKASGSSHGEGIAYDRIADRVSWAGTLALLECTLAD